MKKLFILLSIIFLVNSASAVCEDAQININTASLEELDELYGIGSVKAQAIIDSRPFNTVDDLINVNGIGEITLNNIKSQGLACVDNDERNDEKNAAEDTDENLNLKIGQKIQENNLNKESSIIELENIDLGSKDIKTEEINQFQDENIKGKAVYNFIAFCVLLAFLFGFKILKDKRKNEFG